jgi:hypothetical protein
MERFLDIATITHGACLQAEVIRVERLTAKSGGKYRKLHIRLVEEEKSTILYNTFFENDSSQMIRLEYLLSGICADQNWGDKLSSPDEEESWQSILKKPFEATISQGYCPDSGGIKSFKYITEAKPLPEPTSTEEEKNDFYEMDEEERYPRYNDFIRIDGIWFHEDQL